MKIILLFIICLVNLQNLSAQIKGTVIDSAENKPIENAVVILIKPGIFDTAYTITNKNGEFSFDKIPPDSFSVIITSMGYKPAVKLIPVATIKKTIHLGNINLVNIAKVLNEIIIEEKPITVKEDTIEYRAGAFKVKENAVVEDLLKKLPGVQVDKDGNIKAQGKSVTKIKVNGKDFFGGDPKTATKELPANIVDKVQIIDDYGDQSTVSGIKDADPEKIINIQLKKDKSTGYFGSLTTGIGDKKRYQASANGNYFKGKQQISLFANSNNTSQSLSNFGASGKGIIRTEPDGSNMLSAAGNGDMQLHQNGSALSNGVTITNAAGINYRDEWSKEVNVYGSYSYSNLKNSGYTISSQQNIFAGGIFLNNQNNNFKNLSENHRFYFNLEYRIDSFNYLKVSPSVSYNTNTSNSNTIFDYFTVNAKTSEGYNNLLTNSKNTRVSGSVLYNHRFRKAGRNFSVNFNAGRSENNSDQDSRNNTIQYISPTVTTNRFLFNTQQNGNHNYGIRFTYTEPLSKFRFLDFAFSHNFSYAKNDKEVYNADSATGIKVFNDALSNNYENNYFNNRANVSIRTTAKKYNYTLGISVQPVDLRGFSITKDSAYRSIKRVNVFPLARFAYNFSKSQSLSINYRGNAQQPGFAQLQDVLDVSNPQYLRQGNPDLKPSLNHSINLFYNNFNFITGRVLFTSLAFNTIQNQIVNNTIRIGTSGAQLTKPENVNGYYNISTFYNFSQPFKERQYVFSFNGIINFNHNINLVDSIQNTGKNWLVGQGFNFEFNHKEWLELSVGANFNINSVTYSNAGTNNTSLQNNKFSSWVISSNLNMNISGNWILKYDFEYIINRGLSGVIGKNSAVMNASIEKQLFKKENGIIRLNAFDLFNQNAIITRSINANSIIDSRGNRLTRYFMLTFIYRLQKFTSK